MVRQIRSNKIYNGIKGNFITFLYGFMSKESLDVSTVKMGRVAILCIYTVQYVYKVKDTVTVGTVYGYINSKPCMTGFHLW